MPRCPCRRDRRPATVVLAALVRGRDGAPRRDHRETLVNRRPSLLRPTLAGVRRRATDLRRAADRGMTTAEYAIGTLAACGFAALLVAILRGSAVQGLLMGLITRALALGG